jgi:inhibitor of KinA
MTAPSHIVPLGDQAIMVCFGDRIEDATCSQVRAFSQRLEQSPPAGMTEHVPAYTTVAVYYDPLATTLEKITAAVATLLTDMPEASASMPRIVDISVCYDPQFGVDLESVAAYHGLAVEEVIAIHSGATYFVQMLGFTPGFPYLGGLSPRIATPRRGTPRVQVAAGSVGIAGSQTGIYSLETPGGWQIIGRTPLSLFRPAENPPTLLLPGDRVRFRPISSEEFTALREATA